MLFCYKWLCEARNIELTTCSLLTKSINSRNVAKPLLSLITKKTTSQQNLECWIALGLVQQSRDKYILKFVSSSFKDIVSFSTKSILDNSDEHSIMTFRWTKIVNVLVLNEYITKDNMEKFGIRQKKGTLTIDKILKECSEYEKELSLNKDFLWEIKERINE